MKHLSCSFTSVLLCLMMAWNFQSLEAQTSLSAMHGEWQLHGSYPNGTFQTKWKVQASDQSLDIYEWQSVSYYQKNWVRLPIENATYDGYSLEFTVRKNLAGSWITESYRIQVSNGNRLSCTTQVKDSFLDDNQVGYTEQLIGMPLGISSSYQGNITLVRQ